MNNILSQNAIIQHPHFFEIIKKNGETIYFYDTDKYNVITVAKVASQFFLNILRFEQPRIMENELSHSLLTLKNILQTSDNFITVGIRNPIDRNLSYFYNISNVPDNEVSKLFQTKKNNYQSQIINFTEKTMNLSTTDTINLYFNTDIHTQFNEWFTEFFEITGINQKSFNKTDGLDFYNLPNNNKIMIYTVEKINSNIDNINQLFNLDNYISQPLKFNWINSSQQEEYADHYNNTKSQITYTQSYLDSQLNTDIMKFFYSDEDIQGFYNKYTVQN